MALRLSSKLGPVLLILLLAGPVQGAQKIYWTDTFTAKIQRANPDGTAVEDLVTTRLTYPRGIALDVVAGTMYWTDSGTNKIGRCDLDGSDCVDLVFALQGPRGIVIDFAAHRIYWASSDGGMIRRANLDGSHVDLVATGLHNPMGLTIDFVAGKAYWANLASEGVDTEDDVIQRANLNGSNVEYVVTELVDPVGIALDAAGGKIYWTDFGTGKVQRADTDGSNIEDLVTALDGPMGLALDLEAGKMYWTVAGPGGSSDFDGKIKRSNLDGSDVEDLVTTGLRNPREIAILPGPCVEGEACNDGNRCTGADNCVDGMCVGSPMVTPCDDGNPCTDADVCQDSVCRGAPNDDPCEDGDPCTADVCTEDGCQNTFSPSFDECFNFSLLVTEVNGTPCASCPTANLPATEIRPGDTIMIEAFLGNWAPDLAWGFEWTIDASTFESDTGNALSGFLSPAQVSCSTDSDCHQAFVHSPGCTCNTSHCQTGGFCDARAVAFIDSHRPDYVFTGAGQVCISQQCLPNLRWIGGGSSAADPGYSVYVGSLLLTASEDARGTFVVTMLDRFGGPHTYVMDPGGSWIDGLRLLPLVINFCDVLDSPNDCNGNDFPDECEPDRDGDGVIDDCDPCPDDPSDTTGYDTDGDGVLDCDDQCPGADDALFAPTCMGAIPSVSEWGLLVMTLLLLTGGKIVFARRRAVGCAANR